MWFKKKVIYSKCWAMTVGLIWVYIQSIIYHSHWLILFPWIPVDPRMVRLKNHPFEQRKSVFGKLLPSGKRLHNELERSTIFNGKTHYFYGHFQ
jgi:hypothetical protein